jgi:hypothetical protein
VKRKGRRKETPASYHLKLRKTPDYDFLNLRRKPARPTSPEPIKSKVVGRGTVALYVKMSWGWKAGFEVFKDPKFTPVPSVASCVARRNPA